MIRAERELEPDVWDPGREDRHEVCATRRFARAFTMIEIAISLAVIGFALVAIIGILPKAMNVQKENREETIINQDFSVFLDALRNGAMGLDDLTNYVMAITNYQTLYTGRKEQMGKATDFGYNQAGSWPIPNFPLTSGYRIIGLLGTPKYTENPQDRSGFASNYVVAFVRTISGSAAEKFPQNNPAVQELALGYRLVSEVSPYVNYDWNWTNFTDTRIAGDTNEITRRSNYWMVVKNLQTNLYDVRLTFRWPLFRNGSAGNGRMAFRAMAGGHLFQTNDNGLPIYNGGPYSNLYFFEPRNYVKAQ